MQERFIAIYNTESDAVFRYCLFRISDREAALDLVGDVFMRYWDALAKGTPIGNDRAFLFTTARHLVIDRYRKHKTLSLESIFSSEDGEEIEIPDGEDRSSLELGAAGRQLLDMIRKLSETYRQAVYLRYVEDFSPGAIAEILGISESAASVRIHRGIAELRRIAGYDENDTNYAA